MQIHIERIDGDEIEVADEPVTSRPMSGWTETHIGAVYLAADEALGRRWSFGGDDVYSAWTTLDTAVQNVLSTDVSDWMGCDLATAREALAEVMK